jgi:predicted ATPase
VFIGIYGARYGWVAPGEDVSGLEDEYRLSGDKPKLIYLKKSTAEREPRLVALLDRIRADDHACYKAFSTPAELRGLIANDLALLLTERFTLTQRSGSPPGPAAEPSPEPAVGTPTPLPVEPSTGTFPTERTNLPIRRTALIGREGDLRALHDLVLNAEGHLVTLTGAGGCGKTSLGLEVARGLVEHFEAGVWLVELAPLADPDLVPQAVASTLGVRDSPDRPLLDGVIAYLRTRSVLLVLDNCEHLVEACAGLAERLLTACANLHILVTSRELLRIPGEVNWRVPSLPFPDPGRLPPLAELSEMPAVRLFDDRARAAQSRFTLSTQNARAVARVCARLDGMPLALELAAAHVQALTVDTLAERLDEGFRLLVGGSRAAPSRQQTLQATLDWSYNLLEATEQAVLRRLAVFAGGFELDAAEVVCGVEGTASSDVVERLTGLVTKSLVQVTESGGKARYRLLETVRAYGLEHLDDAGETSLVRARHAAYYLDVAERTASAIWAPQLLGPFGKAEQQAQFVPLKRDLDNLRAALAWAEEHREVDTFARLGIALWPFWFVEGYIGEGWRWAETCQPLRTDLSLVLHARSLAVAGCLALWRADNASATRLLEEALPLFREQGDDWSVGLVLSVLGLAIGFSGEVGAARRPLEESLGVYQELDDTFGIGLALLDLGEVLWYWGDLVEARTVLQQALAPLRRAGDVYQLVEALTNLGGLELGSGNARRAAELMREALTLLRESGLRFYLPEALELSAELATMDDAAARAARLFGAAEISRELSGATRYPTASAGYKQALDTARTALPADTFAEAWAAGRALTPSAAIELALAS